MEPVHPHSLEGFAERHRADFDLHEPRPELWDALTARLDAEAAPVAAQPVLRVVAAGLPEPVAGPAPATAAPRRRHRWQPYGLAAGLAVLLLAAGLGEAWKARQPQGAVAAAAGVAAPDEALYQAGGAGLLVNAPVGGAGVDARLDTAVHGMERYYLGQLAERQTQLGQLAPEAAADWVHELANLDSSYQQLRRELPRHPQPEVVLTAMNRNLQIRLDILDQQLALHGADPQGMAATHGGEYVLADSRHATTADPLGR